MTNERLECDVGGSAEDVLAQIPPMFRAGTRVISGEILPLERAAGRS